MLFGGFSQMQHYVGIYKLYMLRKDIEKAQEYFKKTRELGYYEFRL